MLLPGLWVLPEVSSVREARALPCFGEGARRLCERGGLVFSQISWILQVSMGTTPTETLSVAGNIFVGQVRSWAGDAAPQPLQLSLPWRKGLLLHSKETCIPAWLCFKNNGVFSLAD